MKYIFECLMIGLVLTTVVYFILSLVSPQTIEKYKTEREKINKKNFIEECIKTREYQSCVDDYEKLKELNNVSK